MTGLLVAPPNTLSVQKYAEAHLDVLPVSLSIIRSISPTFGPDTGNSTIHIAGNAFIDTSKLFCKFGLLSTQADFISEKKISCKTPIMAPGTVQVSVVANQKSYFSIGVSYTFYKPIEIHHIFPSFGTVGTTVKVFCTNLFFVPSAVCRFGEIQVQASFNSESDVILCRAPELATPRGALVTISLNGYNFHGGAGDNNISFTYVPDPAVVSLSPNLGWKKGGFEVVIKTNNLLQQSDVLLYCVFGDEDFVLATLLASQHVKCVAPPMRQERPVVTVHVAYGLSDKKKRSGGSSLTYIDAVVVSRIIPSWGSVLGGTLVDVYGENFINLLDLSCKFSEHFTSAEFVSHQHIKCVSPETHEVGKAIPIEVVSRSGTLSTFHSEALFEYHANPSISFIEPLYGTISGGTLITVHGNGFRGRYSPYLSCRFGEFSPPVLATFVDEHKITCSSPPVGDAVNVDGKVIVSVSLNGRDFFQCNESIFTYLPGIHVLSVDPSLGMLSGGTILTVKISQSLLLSKYHDAFRCVFEGDSEYATTPATVVDEEGLLACQSPSSSVGVGHPTVLSLVFNGNETSLTGTLFYYYSSLSIRSISPAFGSSNGGELIEVTGQGFLNVELLGCTFGSAVSPAVTWVSATKILCETPPAWKTSKYLTSSLESSVVLAVTLNGVDFSTSEKAFLFVPNPSVSFIFHRAVEGNDVFIINGNFLERATACRFGLFGSPAPILTKNKTTATCRPPGVPPYSSHFQGTAQLYLSFGYEFVDMNVSLSYKPAIGSSKLYETTLGENITYPEVSIIIPSSVSSSGGEWLTIYGKHFSLFRGTGCLFGAKLFVEGKIGSSNVLYCRSPSQVPGEIALRVVNGVSNLASRNSALLSIFPDSSISYLEPSIGSVNGGTSVLIFGHFFGEAAVFKKFPELVLCRFGDADVPVSRASSTEIECLSPPIIDAFRSDRVKVFVSFNSGMSFSRSFWWYTYEKVVEIRRLTPTFGVISGGTNVLVEGANFRNSTSLKCKFGNVSHVSASFISTNAIQCNSPVGGRTQKVVLAVSNNGVDYSLSGQDFEYYNPFNILSTWPTSGPTIGGTVVTVRGFGFSRSLETLCVFGRMAVVAHYVDSGTITCTSPPSKPGRIPLWVSRKDPQNPAINIRDHADSLELSFLYVQSLSLRAMYPNRGKIDGGNMVFIIGDFIANSTALSCRFGENIVRGSLANNRTLMCPTPPSKTTAAVQVAVSLNSLDFSEFHPMLTFYYEQNCGKGFVCGPTASSWGSKSPNGTFAPYDRNMNFTLCDLGYYQPLAGQTACILCPVPYVCPDFGLPKPVLCPAGFVCDKPGLSYPSQRCPKGHYCLVGTGATFDPSYLALTSSSGRNSSDFDLQNTIRYPVPCPVGYYCRDGVSSKNSLPGNFSTPQKCFKGYKCPRGSFIPEVCAFLMLIN